jgi:phosphoenolpyruvate carboxykinase (ATP)
MPLHPTAYSDLLGKKLADDDADVWLVNTGWTGGPYGIGERFKIAQSRAVIRAAISGALDDVEFRVDPVFGFAVPEECPGIPSEILNPRDTWEDKAAYDEKAQYLAGLFVENFKEFADQAPAAVGAAGPMAR